MNKQGKIKLVLVMMLVLVLLAFPLILSQNNTTSNESLNTTLSPSLNETSEGNITNTTFIVPEEIIEEEIVKDGPEESPTNETPYASLGVNYTDILLPTGDAEIAVRIDKERCVSLNRPTFESVNTYHVFSCEPLFLTFIRVYLHGALLFLFFINDL